MKNLKILYLIILSFGTFTSFCQFDGYALYNKQNNNNAYLIGDGYTEEGQFPFVEKFNLESLKKTRLYTSKLEGKLENLIEYDPKNDQLLVRIESANEYPNYYYKSLIKRRGPIQLTNFENPYKSIQNVHKEVIT